MPSAGFACRSCGERGTVTVLSLGQTPLANALLAEEDLDRPEETFPLELVFCPACTLVQITETVPPEKLFREYVYFSSFSDTMLRHARELAESLIAQRGLGPDSLVIEIASNDGYLLRNYHRRGVPVLGVEPARNVARVARDEHGIPTLAEFFGAELARKLAAEGTRANVIHAHNVLAHVADLNGFVEGVGLLLAPGGVAVIEVPYVRDLVENCEFDTIYHEHLCYFSLTALERLFARHGMRVLDAERVAIHGGTLRLTVGRGEGNPSPQPPPRSGEGEQRQPLPPAPSPKRRGGAKPLPPPSLLGKGAGGFGPSPPPSRVAALLAEEQHAGIEQAGYYGDFARRVERLKRDLRRLLAGLRRKGRTVAAYGASAKGSTLLNAFGIGRETIDFVADRSTVKQGKFTPGTRLPIVAPGELLRRMPDYVLLLTWNFADEILEQQAEYRQRGGKFILPVPEVRVV